MPPMPGLRACATHTITDADTAVALRSGEVPVLGTPRLVALIEEATVKALDGSLADERQRRWATRWWPQPPSSAWWLRPNGSSTGST